MSQHAWPGLFKWNKDIVNVINYTSVYPVMTCQNGCCDSGVLLLQISDSPDMILLTSLSLAMFTVG